MKPGNKQHLPLPLHQLLPTGSCPVGVPVLTSFSDGVQCGSVSQINPFLPNLFFWSWCFITATETLIKTILNLRRGLAQRGTTAVPPAPHWSTALSNSQSPLSGEVNVLQEEREGAVQGFMDGAHRHETGAGRVSSLATAVW